jgi:biotin operon repressor
MPRVPTRAARTRGAPHADRAACAFSVGDTRTADGGGSRSKLSFDLPFSQEVMGDALGLSVPHLNRTLAKLRADGLISISNHRVEFLDLNALEMLGHFQPVALTRVPVPSSSEVHDRASPQAKRLRPAQARS